MDEKFQAHLGGVVSALKQGDVVPFLGAGANLCDRSEDARWQPQSTAIVPDAGELVSYLAEQYQYPIGATNRELARVAQYAAVKRGTGPLYKDLRGVFARDYPPTSLHSFLATLPERLRRKGYPPRSDDNQEFFLVVSTNYDDLLEQAFAAAGQPFHVLWYRAEGKRQGHFFHRRPDGETVEIKVPNKYRELHGNELPVVLKIHGTVDRLDRERDSFVITEDDYVEYLSELSRANLIPVPLNRILKERHFLFLGYSLKDWNLRVILNRIREEQELSWQFWAVQKVPDQVDQAFWERRGVEILYMSLADYVVALAAEIDRLPAAGAAV